MNKKAIEIGISFFVTLVIALVVFGFAMSFAFKFFGKAKDYQRQLDQNTKSQIENLIINSGDRVAAYPTQVQLHSGENVAVGVGILNILGDEKEFTVNVNCSKLILNDGTPATEEETEAECSKIKIVYLPEHTIKNNANEIFSVSIRNTGALLGTYIIDIKVIYPVAQLYGGIQKIYLKSV